MSGTCIARWLRFTVAWQVDPNLMTGILDEIYISSPIWLQQVMVGVYGYGWYHRRFNRQFHNWCDALESHEAWSSTQFRAYQEEYLKKIVLAAQSSPYYREVFRAADISPVSVSLGTLSNLPILSKETLRKHPRALLTQTPKRGTLIFHSSGTTGTPTDIYYSPKFHALESAVQAARNLGWAEVDYHSRRVMFGARKVCRFDQHTPPYWRYSPWENMAYASIYHLSPTNIPRYIDFLSDYLPDIIMGYPNALNIIASYVLETGKNLAPVKAIITTSETVTDLIRRTVETAWGCKIYDQYGAVEGCLFASQCEHGRYHVSPEIGIVEIVNSKGTPCALGEVGEVIATGLQNFIQPLIRYKIGDAARWAIDQSCPCGRQMPILEAIEGRFEDVCYTPDGRQMLRFDTVFKGVENIIKAQIVQEKVDLFSINLVPGKHFGLGDIELLKKNMALHVGSTVEVVINQMSEIPRSDTGKFRAVMCKLSKEQREKLLR